MAYIIVVCMLAFDWGNNHSKNAVILISCIMVFTADDPEQHTEVDDKYDALKVEKDKLLNVQIRTDKTLDAYKKHLDTLQQCLNKR